MFLEAYIKNPRTKLFAKSIFTSILKVSDKMAFCDMAIFMVFEAKMINLGLIDSLLGQLGCPLILM